MNVPTSDAGSARLGMSVAEMLRRNRKMTRIDQADGDEQRQLDVVHRLADRRRAIAADVERHRRRQLLADRRQQRLDRVDDLDDVGARLLAGSTDQTQRSPFCQLADLSFSTPS